MVYDLSDLVDFHTEKYRKESQVDVKSIVYDKI